MGWIRDSQLEASKVKQELRGEVDVKDPNVIGRGDIEEVRNHQGKDDAIPEEGRSEDVREGERDEKVMRKE